MVAADAACATNCTDTWLQVVGAAPFIYKVKDWIKWTSKQSQETHAALWGVCNAIKVSLHKMYISLLNGNSHHALRSGNLTRSMKE
jgi:hypothetical protein